MSRLLARIGITLPDPDRPNFAGSGSPHNFAGYGCSILLPDPGRHSCDGFNPHGSV